MQLKIGFAAIAVLFGCHFAQADCLKDAEKINGAMAKAGPYREIQNITYADGDVKTIIGDLTAPDKYRQIQISSTGKSGSLLYMGNRMWSVRNDQRPIENTTSSAKNIAEGQIKNAAIRIDLQNTKPTCQFENVEFNIKAERFEWQDKGKTYTTDYQLWTDIKTNLVIKRTWDYKALGDIANNHAISTVLYSKQTAVHEQN